MAERMTDATGSRRRAQRRRLTPPVLRVPAVERRPLLRSLDVARAGRFSLLIGPPGYGKTTALAQWQARLAGEGVMTAWYTASDLDREPGTFLQMLALSLDAAGLDIGEAVGPRTGDVSVDLMLDAILLAIERFPEPLVMIVDDYERVEHEAIARIVDAIIEALPDHAHLVLATRRKPALSLSVMLAQGSVRILDAAELQLDRGEIARMLETPDDHEVARVLAQTEGWPVAVQLYKLWRTRQNRGEAPDFGGQVEEMADYLAGQVLADLPDDLRALILDMAPFDFVEPDLADRITGRADSAARLAEVRTRLPALIEQNVVDGEPAYRLHPLLADYALSQRRRGTAEARRIHILAAEWFHAHQRYAAAIRHAVLSGDSTVQVALLDSLPFIELFLAFGAGELRAILRETPPRRIAQLPRLGLMAALAHFKTGAFGQAQAMLAAVRAPESADPRFAAERAALSLLFDLYVDGLHAEAEERARDLLSLAPDLPLLWTWSENILIVIHQQRGDLDAARLALARTRQMYEAGGMKSFAEAHLLSHDMLISLAQGALRRAGEQASAVLRGYRETRGIEPVATSMARITLAVIDHERNYRESAGDAIRLALDQFGEGEAWLDQIALAWPVIADVVARRHGRDAAAAMIATFRTRLDARGMRSCDGFLHALGAWIAAHGPATAAIVQDRRLRTSADAATHGVPWRERDMARRALATAALAAGDHRTAVGWADALIEDGREHDRLGPRVKGLVLRALALDAGGDGAGAETAIDEAVGLACQEGMTACFVEEGAALRRLLDAAQDRADTAIVRRHAEAVLRTLDAHPQFRPPNALTDREAEIVAHLADGASNKLIARRLGLTDNTVKFHLKRIFVKLGVSSRKEAVARTRER